MPSHCDLMCALVLLSIWGCVISNPIHQERCQHVRQSFHKFQIKSDHHSHIITDICPHLSNSCCVGLEGAIENKARQYFSDQMKFIFEHFRTQFFQDHKRIRDYLIATLDNTIEKVNQTFSNRIAFANKKLIEFVNQNVFQSSTVFFHSSVHSLDSLVDDLLKAIIISELEKSYVSKNIRLFILFMFILVYAKLI